MPKSKLSALFSLLLVFSSGVLVGAVAHRLYSVPSVNGVLRDQPQRKMDPEEVRKHIVEETRREVKLDDQQINRLNENYDRTREQFDQLHKKMNSEGQAIRDAQTAEIKAILRPDQMALFDQLQAKRQAERDRERKRRQQQGPPPPPR